MSTAKKPATVEAYLKNLPADRREAVSAIRDTINANLDPAFSEGIQYGMIGWSVPHSMFPDGYHCDPSQPLPFASVASQKNHIGIYLFCLYMDEAEQGRFADAWKATGKKLDMGKSCVRVKKLEDVPLDVLGEAIGRITAAGFVRQYQAQRAAAASGTKKPAAKKSVAKRTTKKTTKSVAKKVTKKAAKSPSRKKPVGKKTASKKPVTKKPRK